MTSPFNPKRMLIIICFVLRIRNGTHKQADAAELRVAFERRRLVLLGNAFPALSDQLVNGGHTGRSPSGADAMRPRLRGATIS